MKVYAFLVTVSMIMIICLLTRQPAREYFAIATGFKYGECDKMPVPDQIVQTSRSAPFYDLNSVRQPLCSYKNYTFPPPLEYPEIVCPDIPPELQYWNSAVLSHPQTAFLI